jgi:hypothetical protein
MFVALAGYIPQRNKINIKYKTSIVEACKNNLMPTLWKKKQKQSVEVVISYSAEFGKNWAQKIQKFHIFQPFQGKPFLIVSSCEK